MAVPHIRLAQWQKIDALVRVWLEQRQRLIVLLCALQGLKGLDPGPSHSPHARIQEFCQLLMDYISTGYFEVYQELVREARQFRGGMPLAAAHLLGQLDASTTEALAFNEDFDTADHCLGLLDQLPERLTQLTQALEERFALEDQLILSVHQQQQRRRQGTRLH